MEEGREKERKVQGQKQILPKHLNRLERNSFCDLINHANMPIRNERLSPIGKARREVSRNEFVEKGGMPDRVKRFQEINSSKDI